MYRLFITQWLPLPQWLSTTRWLFSSRWLRCLVLSSAVFALAACSDSAPQSSSETDGAAVPALSETQRLNAWLDEQYAEQLQFSPMLKTRLGDKSDYDQLDDFSLAAEQRDLDWLRESVAEMEASFDVEQLNEDGTYDAGLC